MMNIVNIVGAKLNFEFSELWDGKTSERIIEVFKNLNT